MIGLQDVQEANDGSRVRNKYLKAFSAKSY